MATYTTTTYANLQPKSIEGGNQSVGGQFAYGATASSAGDIIFLAKLPYNAYIVDFKEDHTSGSTALGIDFGLANGHFNGGAPSLSCLISGGAQATVNRNAVNGSTNLNVSLSANDVYGYAILGAKIASGTQTTSVFINWTVSYRVDS